MPQSPPGVKPEVSARLTCVFRYVCVSVCTDETQHVGDCNRDITKAV